MYRHETFRRVPQVHGASRPFADRLARRNAEARSGLPKTSGCEPEQARPETGQQKAESCYAFRFRPRGNRNLERDFRFFIILRRQFCIRQSLTYDLLTQQTETVRIIQWIVLRGAVVEPERLLIDVTEQVERLNGNVSSAKSALQQRPEIFHALHMNLSVNVLLKVVHELMLVFRIQVVVTSELIRHNRRTGFNKITYRAMHSGILAITDDPRLDLSTTLKCSNHYSLSMSALHPNAIAKTAALALVHVSRLATDVSLINLDRSVRAAKLPAILPVLHPETNAMQHEPCRLLRDSQRAVNLPRRNAILAIGNHPHHRQPLLKTKRRVPKHSPGLDAELRLRVPRLALPQAARWHKANVLASARRTGYAALPAPQGQIVDAVIRVLEVDDCV